MGIVKSTLGFAGNVIAEKDRRANRKRKKAAEALKNPIKPPFYYLTIPARETAEEEGKLKGRGSAYTVKAIREALRGGVMPSGYSEEQMIKVGFPDEVKAYRAKLAEEDSNLRHNLGKLIDQLADELDSIKVETPSDFEDIGVTEKDIQQLRDVAAEAKKADPEKPDEMIDVEELDAVLTRIRTISQDSTSAKTARENLKKLEDQVNKAQEDRNQSVLELARRAYTSKIGNRRQRQGLPPLPSDEGDQQLSKGPAAGGTR